MSYSAFVQSTAGSAGLPFVSRRSPVYGIRGMVASAQPLATEAGLRVLQQGGNAADAAVAVAAALCVTEPCSTGMGGDAFALYYDAASRKVHCMQGNGASPAALTLDYVRTTARIQGTELPRLSALTVAVPGAVALWEDALRDWGRLQLAQVLKPAIQLADTGFAVSPITAYHWGKSAYAIRKQGCTEAAAGALLQANGQAPVAGQRWCNKHMAATLQRVAQLGAKEGFYTGPVAEAIVEAVKSRGGVLELGDLSSHATARVDPICTTYRGLTVWEVPPPTAGLVALMALNYLEADTSLHLPGRVTAEQLAPDQKHPEPREQQLPAGAYQPWLKSSQAPHDTAADGCKSHAWLHSAIESCRLAFADALGYSGDPRVVQVPLQQLLDKQRAQQRRREYFRPDQAGQPAPDPAVAQQRQQAGDTVQFTVIDGEGNGCSFIQSNYMGFGSGIVPKGCGFTLQNRCHNFTLDPSSPNVLGPRKRPYHTIMPGLVTDSEGDLLMTFGCMGGFMQPQGHLQVLSSIVDYGLDPQAALDAPRFCIDKVDSCIGPSSVAVSHVLLEEGFTQQAAQQLRAKGHNVRWPVGGDARSIFGRGQVILRDKHSGVLCAGSDPRADGCAMGW